MKLKILKIAFIVWVAIWAFFTLRELFLKKNFKDYTALLSRSLEDKRAYVSDEKFYEFIQFCKKTMPEGSTYSLLIAKEDFDESIYGRRAAYYLYPDEEKDWAEFILVYHLQDVKRDGYVVFARLDDKRYILKKRG